MKSGYEFGSSVESGVAGGGTGCCGGGNPLTLPEGRFGDTWVLSLRFLRRENDVVTEVPVTLRSLYAAISEVEKAPTSGTWSLGWTEVEAELVGGVVYTFDTFDNAVALAGPTDLAMHDRVRLVRGADGVLPTGLTEGTTYYVKTVSNVLYAGLFTGGGATEDGDTIYLDTPYPDASLVRVGAVITFASGYGSYTVAGFDGATITTVEPIVSGGIPGGVAIGVEMVQVTLALSQGGAEVDFSGAASGSVYMMRLGDEVAMKSAALPWDAGADVVKGALNAVLATGADMVLGRVVSRSGVTVTLADAVPAWAEGTALAGQVVRVDTVGGLVEATVVSVAGAVVTLAGAAGNGWLGCAVLRRNVVGTVVKEATAKEPYGCYTFSLIDGAAWPGSGAGGGLTLGVGDVNTLLPVAAVRCREWLRYAAWWHEVRLVQVAVAATESWEAVLPDPPSVVGVRDGAVVTTLAPAVNELQELVVPADFRGSYFMHWEGRKSGCGG